jgi:hypothetical protein
MENKTERKDRVERLKRLSAPGMSLQDLIRCVMSADARPLLEREKEERQRKKKQTDRREKQRKDK